MSSSTTTTTATTPEKLQEARQQPACPCCGKLMDAYGQIYATRVSVNGTDYFCNNPACCCDTRPRE